MSAQIREEAARWFIRMNRATGEERDAVATSAWRAWLEASPEHAREYAAFETLWQDFDSTSRTHALADATQQMNRSRRRAVARGALGLAGMGLIGLLGRQAWNAWQDSPVYERSEDTAIGQRLTLHPPDGSEVTLGPGSSSRLLYSRRRRSVKLLRGEALFDVASETARPFVVDAGSARITVRGTRFVVSRLSEVVRVSVARGTVWLATQAGGAPLSLHAGEVGELADDGSSGGTSPRRVQRDAQDAFAATERGLIVFDQAGLAEIAVTLSRWRRQPVRTDVSVSAGPRITAAVQARDVESFLQALPRIAVVSVQERENALWLSSPAKK